MRGHTSTVRLLWEHAGAHLESAVRAVEELVGKASSPWERVELRRRGKVALASLATTARGHAQLLADHVAHSERAEAAMTTLLAEEEEAREQARQPASARSGKSKRNKNVKRPPGPGSGSGSRAGEPPSSAMAVPAPQPLAAAETGKELAEGAPAAVEGNLVDEENAEREVLSALASLNAAAGADKVPVAETPQGSGAHGGSTVPLPDEYVCPITTEIMADPVVTVGNAPAHKTPTSHTHAWSHPEPNPYIIACVPLSACIIKYNICACRPTDLPTSARRSRSGSHGTAPRQ